MCHAMKQNTCFILIIILNTTYLKLPILIWLNPQEICKNITWENIIE
jgi:hypothetical protein